MSTIGRALGGSTMYVMSVMTNQGWFFKVQSAEGRSHRLESRRLCPLQCCPLVCPSTDRPLASDDDHPHQPVHEHFDLLFDRAQAQADPQHIGRVGGQQILPNHDGEGLHFFRLSPGIKKRHQIHCCLFMIHQSLFLKTRRPSRVSSRSWGIPCVKIPTTSS